MADFTTAQGIKLEYSDKIAPARGMSYGGLIRILPDMEPSEALGTFVHELAHSCGAENYVAFASGCA